MSERHLSKQLSLYIDNELSREERLNVEAHLKDCAQCRKELEELKHASSLLAQWQAPTPPDGFDDAVKAVILQHELKKEERPMILNWNSIKVPATALVAVLALVFTMQTYVKRSLQARTRSAANDIGDKFASREKVSYEPYYLATNYHVDENKPASYSADKKEIEKSQIALSRRAGGGFQESTYGELRDNRSDMPVAQSGLEYDSLYRPAAPAEESTATSSIIVVQPVLPAVGEGERVIRTADVTLEVLSGQETYSKITKLTSELGGFLARSDFFKDASGVQSGTFTLRIPKDKFEVALERLREFGKVEGLNTNSQDVSREYADLESRLKTAMIVYDKMMKAIQERKVTIPEAMKLESELTPITDRIEGIRAEIEKLNNLTTFTSITVHFHESKVSPAVIQESVKRAKENIVILALAGLQLLVQSLPAIIGIVIMATILLIIAVRIKRTITHHFKDKDKPKDV